jgi:hypothetical protein
VNPLQNGNSILDCHVNIIQNYLLHPQRQLQNPVRNLIPDLQPLLSRAQLNSQLGRTAVVTCMRFFLFTRFFLSLTFLFFKDFSHHWTIFLGWVQRADIPVSSEIHD